jgi:hypothetical protein
VGRHVSVPTSADPSSILAERILLAAADGERDPFQLRLRALALYPTVNDVGEQVRLI